MVRVIVVLVSLTLACYPAQAVGPAVLIAKELVKQIIFDFVQARVEDAIRASFGPCKADLAEDAVTQSRTLTGLLRGSGGGMASLGALGGAGNLGSLSSLGAAGGQVRTVRNLQNVQSTASSVAGAANLASAAGGGDGALAIGQIAGTVSGVAGTAAGMAGSAASVTGAAGAVGAIGGMPNIAGMPNMAGMGGLNALIGQSGGGAEAMAAMSHMMPSGAGVPGMGGADMQQAMAMMQQMMNAKPLDAAEMNELALILESFGRISEAIQPGSACSADDYKRQFMRVSAMSMQPGMPQGGAMMGGVLRMMYTSFKEMQRSTAEAEQVFRQMNAEDRAEYVQTTVAEMKDQPPEGRRAFLAMIDSGMLGMPEDMRSAFRKQLAS